MMYILVACLYLLYIRFHGFIHVFFVYSSPQNILIDDMGMMTLYIAPNIKTVAFYRGNQMG